MKLGGDHIAAQNNTPLTGEVAANEPPAICHAADEIIDGSRKFPAAEPAE